jgi:transposase
MVVVDGQGIPLGVHISSASPGEVTLLETTLATIKVRGRGPGRPRTKPERVIGDKAYDSDRHRERLRRRGIKLIAPHRRNRTRPKTQDGRELRRYKRRWTVERSIAWIGGFRRLLIRWERDPRHYEAFLYIACALIALRKL